MMNKIHLLAILLALLGLAVACGPVPEPDPLAENPANPTAERTGGITAGQTGETDSAPAQAINPTPVNPDPTSLGETVDGIPVGFTAEGRPFMGDPNAPIVIEEFSDFQCPFCARFAEESWPEIKNNHIATGEAMVIFYDFPLSFHAQAEPAAQAARCAGEAGAVSYWAMHDLLFANLDEWGTPDYLPFFQSYAQEIGLDVDEFTACMNSGRHAEAVQADFALGQQRGVTGTPSFFLNGESLVGALPAEAFANAIVKIQNGEPLAELPDPSTVDNADIPPFQMPEPTQLEPSTIPALGDDSAPITIVEFSDYQCPFCGRHVEETMPLLLTELIETGRVRYEFKDFPLDNIHPEARFAAEAARCAAEQDAYWEMHDALFANQSLWSGQGNGATAVFISLADDLGLDSAALGECVASGRHAAAVEADLNEGLALGVTGTPTFFINGYGISGAQPFNLFLMVVEAIETDTLEEMFREAYDAQVQAIQAQQQAQQQPSAPPTPTGPIFVETEGWPSIGDPNAPVTIVEYTDFQCPYCARYNAETFPLIKEQYIDTGLVRYVFKDFPLGFHQQAEAAALAARCAHDQEAFLPMHNLLFTRQTEWSGQTDVATLLKGYAAELGLDTAVFNTCMDNATHVAAIQADLAEGTRIGVSGTPSFLVNGNLVVGALPFASFQQAIESLLAQGE